MLLNPEVLTLLILNFIFAFFGIIAFALSVKIFLKWDLNSTSQAQYKLEKQSFLASTIIKYIFMVKVPLFLFFVFTLDKISNILVGAMCGAGVVDASDYGIYILVLKVLNIYLFAFWLTLHSTDIKNENQPYTKMKFGFFISIFFLFITELILEYLMFSDIDINEMVDCCGVLYSNSSASYISELFTIDTILLLGIFYGVYMLMIIFYFLNNKYIFAVLNVLFIFIAMISLIVFFGTYIYELPTHHCPFCFLQKDYYFVGYLIYILLFLGTFNGILSMFFESFKRSLFFNTSFVLLLSAYPIIYYVKNGVWL
ncbi:MAG: hypothetical protein U9N02_05370 [Campylobacterota bacterium]|nr:hypothetical protein [Campylobacterota bacterium]